MGITPVLSIVSGTYNRLPLLQKMITSARASIPVGVGHEFVIVDGGSTDGSLEWLREQPDVNLIEHGALLGIKKAFCDGAKAARGRYVMMANDDIEFRDHGSILKALVYLEDNPQCGGVAFADNRRNVYNPQGVHRVNLQPARRNGEAVHVVYAQVGLFPRWLGDLAGWWGDDDPAFTAQSYGTDNYLSSRIWEMGYTIDSVEGVIVHDFAPEDELRAINEGHPADGKGDGHLYYERYPHGPDIPAEVTVASPTRRLLRILYLPIYERGHTQQKRQKHGLRDALVYPHGAYKGALVYEWDYLASPDVNGELFGILDSFKPDMILSQYHGADVITPGILHQVRMRYGNVVMVNWNGDYWPHGLIDTKMIALLRHIDLQLVVNGGVLETYQQEGIKAAYWQIGYEDPGDTLPDVKAHDIVFLGTAYKPPDLPTNTRQELGDWLRQNYSNVGLYGTGWRDGNGECLYDFATGKALYNQAKIAIGDNMYPAAVGFVSNRFFQALAAGGALLLHQKVPRLDDLTGIQDGVHYVAWENYSDLKTKLDFFLSHEDARRKIADAGTALVREKHSFEARVEQLFRDLIPLADRKLQNKIGLQYLGAHTRQFGAGRGQSTGIKYVCNPPAVMYIDPRDLNGFLGDGLWKQVTDIAPDDRLAQGVQ